MSHRRRHARSATRIAAAVMLAGAIAAPAAGAAPTPVETLSPVSQSASSPGVISNTSGDAVAWWSAYNDGLQVSLRPAGGNWDGPTQLSSPGTQVSGSHVVVDGTRTATAVWGEYTMSGGFPGPMLPGPVAIYSSRRPAGGAWSAPERLSSSGVGAGYTSALTVGGDGRILALWGESGALRSATRTRTGAWSAAAAVPSASFAQPPRVALAADGTATAAWQDAMTDHAMVATQPPGGTWTAPVDVSGTIGFVPALAMGEDGDATLVWLWNDKVWAARRATPGGAWTAPQQISLDGAISYYIATVAGDEHGGATAVWSQAVDDGGGNARYDQTVATRAPGGTWSAPVTLGSGDSETPAVAVNADGAVVVAWRRLIDSQWQAQSASHAPGAPWSAIDTLPGLGSVSGSPGVSLDGWGEPLFVATDEGRVKALADDTTGPHLRSLSIPATATAGDPVSFAVSPLDVWSALGTTTWDFGDGVSATGTAATHTYATAGARTVTVTAGDALANATVQTATLTVTAAPTPSPTPTPDPPVAPPTPTPPAPIATPVAPIARLTAGLGASGTATVTAGGTDIGCRVTGAVLAACTVKLYAQSGSHASAAGLRLIGAGTATAPKATRRLDVHVVLNATGRRLLRGSPAGLRVRVVSIGNAPGSAELRLSTHTRIMPARATVTAAYFAARRAALSASAKRSLRALAASAAAAKSVRCVGHTDPSRSSAQYVYQLGLRRARAACAYLQAHGVKAVVSVRSASPPAASNATNAGRARNRRVDVVITNVTRQ